MMVEFYHYYSVGFNIKRPYGYREMWDKITTKISTATAEIKTWCNNTFSLNTHNHDTKYDSKGSSALVQANLNVHDANTTKHITAVERSNWNNKANASHTHTQSQISGSTSALAGKAASNHTHTNMVIVSLYSSIMSKLFQLMFISPYDLLFMRVIYVILFMK